ncbi:amino acid ABC transporter substrate-binding protein [Pseudorhodoplanes sinuspersici]|nr:amino acid ABC transporter substrate-binding protein [Pseudorhodoplanes sinuspersici]RKE70617.1 amino acid/amide ABC transporter substrate-binding protein (HAAT family) [Pseudorhodoplanes sinuspersici]
MLRFMKRLSVCVVTALMLVTGSAHAQDKLKIGFGLGLTGPLAANGKAALISMQIWAEEVNARGGLLGRPIELVYYDDQGAPANVPGIYAKLLDVDKVDLVVSGYGTNMITPAMPLVMQKGMTFMSLIGLNANERFNYDRYFQIAPLGEDPADAFTRGYFDLAAGMNPKPKTVAMLGADAEFGQLALEGARRQAKRLGFKIVFDRAYPPSTVDFSPLVRAIKATNPDFVFLASYPIDTVGIIRAVNEQGLTTGMFGGGMIGPQFAAVRAQLGPLLNGVVGYELYVPEPSIDFPLITEFLNKYTTRATQEKIDQLGFYLPPYAYAAMQVLEQSVKAVGSLDQAKLAQHMHSTTFDTAVGKIKFAKNGEWEKDRILYVQYRGIDGSGIDQWRQPGRAPVLWPQTLKSGDLKYPYVSGKM